jgi:oxygen-independent coproporphyrinogen III oxidase
MSSAVPTELVRAGALTRDSAAAGGLPGLACGVYLHVPFCTRKCSYCAFYSEPGLRSVDRYLDALIRELDHAGAAIVQPRTLFVGGGTPSVLSLRQWERLVEALHRSWSRPPAEWTVECNPATLSLDKARLLRQAGVNRISLGVQSLDEAILQRLGRVHDRTEVIRSFDILRRAGFDNVNLDLMFAVPGQTLDSWLQTLREAVALGSEHLSAYELTYEEDTALYHQLQAGKLDIDEDLASAMFDALHEVTAAHGLHPYEIANFARSHPGHPGPLPAYACQHNVGYWRGWPYLGFGPSASSFADGVRTRKHANTQLYCELLERGEPAIELTDILSPLARAGEIAAFGLRLLVGWPFDQFQKTTGFDLRGPWQGDLDRMVELGWGDLDPFGFRLTPHGLRFADAAAELLLRPDPAPCDLAEGS